MTNDHALAHRMLADMFLYYRLRPHEFTDAAFAGCPKADFASAPLRLAILVDAAPGDPRTNELIDTGWRVLALSGAQVRDDPGSIRQTLLDTAQALA